MNFNLSSFNIQGYFLNKTSILFYDRSVVVKMFLLMHKKECVNYIFECELHSTLHLDYENFSSKSWETRVRKNDGAKKFWLTKQWILTLVRNCSHWKRK